MTRLQVSNKVEKIIEHMRDELNMLNELQKQLKELRSVDVDPSGSFFCPKDHAVRTSQLTAIKWWLEAILYGFNRYVITWNRHPKELRDFPFYVEKTIKAIDKAMKEGQKCITR